MSEPLVFSGNGGAAECEEFIHSVKLNAYSQGQQRNNDWTVDYAELCFVGSALRWYTTLDPQVRRDWDRLQVALLEAWPQKEPQRSERFIGYRMYSLHSP